MRLLRLREAESTVYEHFVSGQVDYSGVSEKQLNELSAQLFANGAPIPFYPRKDQKVDQEVKRIIDDMGVTIPIVWVKDSLYLVGSNKIHLEKKGNKVTA